METEYALDNDQHGAGITLSWLAQILDPNTRSILEPLIGKGDHCLELGAGTGSIARWMTDIVGRDGLVVATDVKPVHIEPHEFLRVVRHDLRTEPLSSLDVKNPRLVHARCVLAHLGNRETLVDELADLLAPGGHVVIEEWGAAGAGYVLHSPYKRTRVLWERYQQALMAHLHLNGNDGTWPPRVHTRMVRAGLTAQTFASSRSWQGGTAGCKLPIALSRQIEDQLVEQGMDREDLAELRTHLADPDVALFANLTYSVVGHKPAEEG